MKKTPVIVLVLILIGFVFLYVTYNSEGFFGGGHGGGGHHGGGEHHGGGYRGVGRWGSGTGGGWIGTYMYPVSINCNCPDNYDFIDNLCVSRSYPFDTVAPFCYN